MEEKKLNSEFKNKIKSQNKNKERNTIIHDLHIDQDVINSGGVSISVKVVNVGGL